MASGTDIPKKSKYLSLKDKVDMIRTAGKNHCMSLRGLGEIFYCGKTQILQTIKKKRIHFVIVNPTLQVVESAQRFLGNQ